MSSQHETTSTRRLALRVAILTWRGWAPQAVIYKGTIDGAPNVWSLDGHHKIEKGKVFGVCGNTHHMLHGTRFRRPRPAPSHHQLHQEAPRLIVRPITSGSTSSSSATFRRTTESTTDAARVCLSHQLTAAVAARLEHAAEDAGRSRRRCAAARSRMRCAAVVAAPRTVAIDQQQPAPARRRDTPTAYGYSMSTMYVITDACSVG